VSEYYEAVSQAFDQAAATYDDLYATNPIMAWMRRESMAVLAATFPPGGLLLEIGCGTGEEALALGRQGRRVAATDISPALIEIARAKDAGRALVTWHVLAAGHLADLIQPYGTAAFDGAYACMGALNCEPSMHQVVAALADLLRPGALFVCSVINRFCAWEIAWGLLHLKPDHAFRRLGKGWIRAGLASSQGSLAVPVRYYSPRSFARMYGPHFQVRTVRALPVLLPPPYLASLVEQHPSLLRRLEWAERTWRERWPFSMMGDHFLMVLQRTSL
jgi:SAM-dependent methyltransferase